MLPKEIAPIGMWERYVLWRPRLSKVTATLASMPPLLNQLSPVILAEHSGTRIDGIDTLRGISILAIILLHINVEIQCSTKQVHQCTKLEENLIKEKR